MIAKKCLVAVTAVLALTGCATAGDDAVGSDGEFTFVSPGGQTRLFYPPQERGVVSGVTGDSLMQEGQKIRLSDFQDQVVVMNLWGSWCGPCRSEADDLQRVQNELGPQGVQVLGINVRDQRTAAADFVNNRGLTYPSIFDPSGRSLLPLKGYPRSTVPSTVILDRDHRVAAIFLTEVLDSELIPEVRKVAQESRQA
ncbi:redoxin domain-containing protein [Allosaccharopolyspora coralli]|uniref:Redoxin domain-containing protein n=1 Tax=Allosaccharopolyspora coralli TaxID=2665642 RepID=A0A5Q3QAG8_9PSEU|nr:TlpA disulfide reductase family protein [Allosaccharopolyspora coralli]QGK71651.1 redoxin domain-containing protein [Allosaccharopolyspora coralli]